MEYIERGRCPQTRARALRGAKMRNWVIKWKTSEDEQTDHVAGQRKNMRRKMIKLRRVSE